MFPKMDLIIGKLHISSSLKMNSLCFSNYRNTRNKATGQFREGGCMSSSSNIGRMFGGLPFRVYWKQDRKGLDFFPISLPVSPRTFAMFGKTSF